MAWWVWALLIWGGLWIAARVWRSLAPPPAQPRIQIDVVEDGPADPTPIYEVDYDSYEQDPSIDVYSGRPLAMTARIAYADANGLKTVRTIQTQRFASSDRDTGILAFCQLRNANRTFLASRIKEFVNLETGEVVSDVSAYIKQSFSQTDLGQAIQVSDEKRDEIDVLMFIAKSNAHLSPKERRIIAEYIGIDDYGEDVVKEVLSDWPWPSKAAMRRAVDRLIAGKLDRLSALNKAAELVARPSKEKNAMSLAALEEVQAYFGTAQRRAGRASLPRKDQL